MNKLIKKHGLFLGLLMMCFLPSFVFGAVASDDFVVPFKDMVIAWMKGNVGLTAAILVMIIAVIWGAFGGGFQVIGKGFVFSVLIGAIVFFADKAFSLGAAFA